MSAIKQLLLPLVVITCITTSSFADEDGFSFDDLDTVEAGEQQELLQMAKDAPNSYNFSKAQDLIKQTEHKSYAPEAMDNTKKVLANAKSKKQREDAERAKKTPSRRKTSTPISSMA